MTITERKWNMRKAVGAAAVVGTIAADSLSTYIASQHGYEETYSPVRYALAHDGYSVLITEAVRASVGVLAIGAGLYAIDLFRRQAQEKKGEQRTSNMSGMFLGGYALYRGYGVASNLLLLASGHTLPLIPYPY